MNKEMGLQCRMVTFFLADEEFLGKPVDRKGDRIPGLLEERICVAPIYQENNILDIKY
jgi:hypothetical protein